MPCDVGAEHIGPCGPDCILLDYFAREKANEGDEPLSDRPPGQQHFLVAIRHSGMPAERQWQFVMEWAEEWQAKVDALRGVLVAAEHALRSYQHGNTAPDLAQEVADAIRAALDGGGPCPDGRHQWTGRQMGGPPDMAESYEWVEYCKVCGVENPGSGEFPAIGSPASRRTPPDAPPAPGSP